MWVFLNDAFLSIVEDRDDKAMLRVRARAKEDIQRVFPDAAVLERPKNDYRFMALIERSAVAMAMAECVLAVDYDNFKNSVQEDDRHAAYQRVWGVMFSWGQDRLFQLLRSRATPRTQASMPRCVCKQFGVRYCPVHGD